MIIFQKDLKFFGKVLEMNRLLMMMVMMMMTVKTYDSIRKIPTCQGDDYTTGCLLDYKYFKSYYKMIAIDLSKEQALDADPKTTQQVDFSKNLNQGEGAEIFVFHTFNIKLSNSQLNILQSGIKNSTEVT